MKLKFAAMLPEITRHLFRKPATVEVPFQNIPQPKDLRGHGRALLMGYAAASKEWIFQVDSDGQFNPADLNHLIDCCKEYFHQHGWPNLPIEIELTKTDKYYMSPWNWPGLDYIVKFNFMYLTDVTQTAAEKEVINVHLHGLWDYLMQAGIPFKAHWG